MQYLISILLFHANKMPSLINKAKFYQIKNRLIQKYGTKTGYDVQFIEGKQCHSCGGSGRHPKYGYDGKVYDWADCYHCFAGWYKLPRYIILDKLKFGKFVFHQPVHEFNSKERLQIYLDENPNPPSAMIEGYIEHNKGKYWVAYLFWLVFAPKVYYKEFIKKIGCTYYHKVVTPYNLLNNVIGLLTKKWIRAYVWKKYFKTKQEPQPIRYTPSYEDLNDEMPF